MKTKKRLRIVAMIFCLSLLALVTLPSAKADQWNNKTTVTFSAPVEVPGVGAQVLPAGTYIFKLVNSPSDRNIVQIFNEAGDHVYTTILAISNYRLKPTDKTVMTFSERPEGQPEAIKAWFYPGAQWGQEFVYPKEKAVVLAKLTGEPVLATTETPTTPEALKTAPVEAVTPAGAEVPATQVVEAPPPAQAQSTQMAAVEPTTMPKTASEIPLLALMGLLSLGAGLAATLALKQKETA
ncbi:MAG TPA: hypothetical protein VNJ52_08355 [Patescibacteria group bacterium]|nr:hypothetical protein [Patescibacteria group bacterium]